MGVGVKVSRGWRHGKMIDWMVWMAIDNNS